MVDSVRRPWGQSPRQSCCKFTPYWSSWRRPGLHRSQRLFGSSRVQVAETGWAESCSVTPSVMRSPHRARLQWPVGQLASLLTVAKAVTKDNYTDPYKHSTHSDSSYSGDMLLPILSEVTSNSYKLLLEQQEGGKFHVLLHPLRGDATETDLQQMTELDFGAWCGRRMTLRVLVALPKIKLHNSKFFGDERHLFINEVQIQTTSDSSSPPLSQINQSIIRNNESRTLLSAQRIKVTWSVWMRNGIISKHPTLRLHWSVDVVYVQRFKLKLFIGFY